MGSIGLQNKDLSSLYYTGSSRKIVLVCPEKKMFLGYNGHSLVSDRFDAWCGTRTQLNNLRRVSPTARSLRAQYDIYRNGKGSVVV